MTPILIICGVVLIVAIFKRAYDTYHGVDPTWSNTERGVHPGWQMNP